MTQTVFEKMKTAISVLKLDFTTEEFATFADDQELSEEAIEAVQTVFSYISEKKQQTTVQTLLKLSRLPKKAPKTFENFDFSLLKSRDLDRIRALPSLGAVYSHRNRGCGQNLGLNKSKEASHVHIRTKNYGGKALSEIWP